MFINNKKQILTWKLPNPITVMSIAKAAKEANGFNLVQDFPEGLNTGSGK